MHSYKLLILQKLNAFSTCKHNINADSVVYIGSYNYMYIQIKCKVKKLN